MAGEALHGSRGFWAEWRRPEVGGQWAARGFLLPGQLDSAKLELSAHSLLFSSLSLSLSHWPGANYWAPVIEAARLLHSILTLAARSGLGLALGLGFGLWLEFEFRFGNGIGDRGGFAGGLNCARRARRRVTRPTKRGAARWSRDLASCGSLARSLARAGRSRPPWAPNATSCPLRRAGQLMLAARMRGDAAGGAVAAALLLLLRARAGSLRGAYCCGPSLSWPALNC